MMWRTSAMVAPAMRMAPVKWWMLPLVMSVFSRACRTGLPAAYAPLRETESIHSLPDSAYGA